MFTEQLTLISSPRSLERASLACQPQKGSCRMTQADLEYAICGTFMKHTGERLSSKESELMESSREFLQTYTNFKKKQIESSRTLDTLIQDMTEKSVSIDEDRGFGLNRKTSALLGSRKNLLLLNDHLAEIQQHCNSACSHFFHGLVAEYKKMQVKIKQFESKESNLLRRQQFVQKLHEENLILKKKLQHQQDKIDHMASENTLLKEKNRSINSCINDKINSLNSSNKYFEINHKVYKDIKSYLQDKEITLKQQSDNITNVEQSVLRAIEVSFKGDSCMKCCQILRKLKDSIIRLKKYFEGESLQFEKIYDKYKKTMYSLKSRAVT